MKSLKGIGLLLVANILIMVTLSITVPIVINVILPMFGIDVRGSVDLTSLVWALMFGFGGVHQLGLLQADGPRHVGLLPDYATSYSRGTADLQLGTGNRESSPHQHARGVDLRIAGSQRLRYWPE